MSTEATHDHAHAPAHHFHIVINGQPKTVKAHENTFEEIVAIAYDHNVPEGENWAFTITYRGGHDGQLAGSLTEDECVKLKEGMVFNVRATDKS